MCARSRRGQCTGLSNWTILQNGLWYADLIIFCFDRLYLGSKQLLKQNGMQLQLSHFSHLFSMSCNKIVVTSTAVNQEWYVFRS